MKKTFPRLTAGSLPALIALVLVLGTTTTASASFTDVQTFHPNYDAITFVEEEGIVGGYEDGTYKPENKVNRAEFTKILVGTALGYNSQQDPSGYDIYSLSGVPFRDILYNDWYIPYVRKALENDIIGGYPDGTFRGGNEINRAEAAKIIVKSLGIKTLDETANTNWFDIYVYALEEMNAVPPELPCYDMTVTRGQLAEMIWRVKKDITYKDAIHTIALGEDGKLRYDPSVRTWECDDKGLKRDNLFGDSPSFADEDIPTAEFAPRIIELDDSDPNNGSTMYDFDTEQRTNIDVSIDMMMGSIFYENNWMHGMDWQVVPMEGSFEEIVSCPAEGYASVYDVDPETHFGTPYNAYAGDIYCLKTSDGKHVLLEILDDYNENYERYLKIQYIFK